MHSLQGGKPTSDLAASLAGGLSLACFLVAFLPQLYKNHRRRSVTGLSLPLLVGWALGDGAGLLAVLLTPQSWAQRAIAVYFVMLDVLILGQYAWFARRGAAGPVPPFWEGAAEWADAMAEEEEDVHQDPASSGAPRPETRPERATRPLPPTSPPREPLLRGALGLALLGMLCAVASAHTDLPATVPPSPVVPSAPYTHLPLGSVLSWISNTCYFLARIPQIVEHYREKSVAGISLAVFGLTIAGNLLYGAAIALRRPALDAGFVALTLPYLLGSAGTLVFDLIILYQAYLYHGFAA